MDKLTFVLTPEEADLAVRALGEMPYKTTAKLISNLQNQYQVQTATKKKSEAKPGDNGEATGKAIEPVGKGKR